MNDENQDERVSIVLDVMIGLRNRGSWCGETHIQKTVFILKSLGIEELDYDFLLYKHGPYSFDLHSELGVLRSANFISLSFLQEKYGPSLEVSKGLVEKFRQKNKIARKDIKKKMDFVVEWVGSRDVKSLERISTAFMVLLDIPHASTDERASVLRKIKPHIGVLEAEQATKQVDMKFDEAKKLRLI